MACGRDYREHGAVESVKFQMPSQVTFICATVNGQAALFERHPHQP